MTANALLWVTAIATALTALLTGTGGLAAWLACRRERERDNPIVERELNWTDEEPQFLRLSLVIRNRLAERLVLDEVRILSPKGMGIGSANGPARNVYNEPGAPEPTRSRVMTVQRTVQPHGSPADRFSGGDALWEKFALWPPADWHGGEVRFAIRLSSRGGALKDRRIRMKLRSGPRTPLRKPPPI